MSEKNDLDIALQCIDAGQQEKAAPILLNVYKKTRDQSIKLQTILALIVCLNQLQYNQMLTTLCSEGISLTTQSETDTKKYLMARKANFMSYDVGILEYEKNNLLLMPGWFAFSTEADKNKFERINIQVLKQELEIEELIKEASGVSEDENNKSIRAHINLAIGEIYGQRYLNYKMKYIVQNPKVKKWSNYHFIKRYSLDNYLLYNKNQRSKLKECTYLCLKCLQKAIRLFKEDNDEANASHALYTLALQFKSFFRFRKAAKYLKDAKKIAEKCNNTFLLTSISVMEKSIKMRNKDIPNYIEGETRERQF